MMIRTTAKWLGEIASLRSIAIFLIIFVHLDLFLKQNYGILMNSYFHEFIASVGLGLFFFVSGFSIFGRYKHILTLSDITCFYKKRLVRIYPLYLLSILASFLLGMNSIGIYSDKYTLFTILMHVLGLQSIIGYIFNISEIPALWFVSVILLFYLTYPFIVFKSAGRFALLLRSSAIYVLLISLRFYLGLFDDSVFKYFPIFIFGILFSERINLRNCRDNEEPNKLPKPFMILPIMTLITILILLILFYFKSFGFSALVSLILKNILYDLIVIFICVQFYILVSSSEKLTINYSRYFFTFISISSYAVYLFHLQILSIITKFFINATTNDQLFDLFVILIGLPSMFIISYLIQILYSKIEISFFTNS